jgi:hypothetical protein
MLTIYFQGELAHRLLKRLYGLTNKQNAPGQVASRYRRENHFGSPESHDPTLTPIHGSGCENSEESPELHHTMTNSRNDPVSLSYFSNTADPAAKVSLHLFRTESSSNVASRILFTSSESIFSADSLEKALTMTTPLCLQMMSEIQFG